MAWPVRALTGHSGVWGTVAIDATPVRAHRSAAGAKGGAFAQAIGTSRGGRTSKLHALTDEDGRPRVLLVSAGNINDMTMAQALIAAAGRFGSKADEMVHPRPARPGPDAAPGSNLDRQDNVRPIWLMRG